MALLLALGARAPLTVINALSATGGHTREADVAYGPLRRQQLDMYVSGAWRRLVDGRWPFFSMTAHGTAASGPITGSTAPQSLSAAS